MKNHKRQPRPKREALSTGKALPKSPGLGSGTVQPRKDDTPPDIFTRLEKRGVDYDKIKRIVQFERPDYTLFFAQWFRGRRISQALKQIDEWKKLLKRDFVLSASQDLKSQVEQFILQTELTVWKALIEANPQVGSWELHIRIRPNDRDEKGRPVQPDQEIIAVNLQTKETKRDEIPGGKFPGLSSLTASWKRAYEKLGLWEQMWKGDPSRMLISGHSRQGWPVFTRLIIPRLYEFMAPHYKSPGRYSAKIDRDAAEAKRPALYPNTLLQDMLEILKMEHDYAFKETTVDQLRADLQRYLAEKRRFSTSKRPLELSHPKTPKSST